MDCLVIIAVIWAMLYCFIQFAKKEYVEEEYLAILSDVEGRLEWAHTRRFFPFGMKAQLEVTSNLLGKAKNHWGKHQWQQAYRSIAQSQEAMNKAQCLYIQALDMR
ncbi:hypothetical protein [Desulforhopalus singaporensis]|uniref:Uncharacterized protein n=1 Tax=Desulforhopalus singaporensis TaxID=91360 RepID=A0A1H0MFG9_9BACT|nr:hypothetical protein [Desulforhopalus singaporensis]SDO79183.1 hypothetical protein SAMN05660330_01028 [Desulforhopalus singaporensis]